MNGKKYSESHEWAELDQDGMVTIGISDYAQSKLGDVVYVDLPDVGNEFHIGDEFGTVESVKSASSVFCPVSGRVVAVNETLNNAPERINTEAEGDAWFIKLEPGELHELESLLDAAAYAEHVKE